MISDTSLNNNWTCNTTNKITTYLRNQPYWWDPLCRLLIDDQDRLPTMDWYPVVISSTLVYCLWQHSSHGYRHWQDWHYRYHDSQRTRCSDKPVCSMLRCTLAIQSVLQTLQTTQHNFQHITIQHQFQYNVCNNYAKWSTNYTLRIIFLNVEKNCLCQKHNRTKTRVVTFKVHFRFVSVNLNFYKKLSCRRETARQLRMSI